MLLARPAVIDQDLTGSLPGIDQHFLPGIGSDLRPILKTATIEPTSVQGLAQHPIAVAFRQMIRPTIVLETPLSPSQR